METDSIHPVGVVGAGGYTGRELLRILAGHGGVEVVFATSDSAAGTDTPVPGLSLVESREAPLDEAEVIFLCVPHGSAGPWARTLRDRGLRVVDLSQDHRPGSPGEAEAVYGLPELFRSRIPPARLVANPGCYPTGILLALVPLVREGLVGADRPVVVNAASGVTGAGRTPRTDLLFAEVYGDFRPYAAGNRHRHLAEVRSVLGDGVSLLFTPHLLPIPRGILETIALPLREGVGEGEVRAVWEEAYRGSPVVRVLPDGLPGLAHVVGTDRLALGVVLNEGVEPPVATVGVALDNLGKGAAGQAVQNMNLMLGFPEERGLRC